MLRCQFLLKICIKNRVLNQKFYILIKFTLEDIFNVSDFRGWGVKFRASCHVFRYYTHVKENRVTIYWYESLTENAHGIG